MAILILAKYHHVPYDDVYDAIFGVSSKIDPDSSPFRDHLYMNNAGDGDENDWLVVFAANVVSGVVCYFVSVNAIQAKVQTIAYSSAIVMATPVTLMFALFGFCGASSGKSVMAEGMNINDLYWNCFDGFSDVRSLIMARPIVIMGILWWIGQLIITRHLWTPKSERLVKAERYGNKNTTFLFIYLFTICLATYTHVYASPV
jgi:hypothetical protein